MLALSPLRGVRIIADAATVDGVALRVATESSIGSPGGTAFSAPASVVLRLAPDELLVVAIAPVGQAASGPSAATGGPTLTSFASNPRDSIFDGSAGQGIDGDLAAIVVEEDGFSGCWLSNAEFDERVRSHVDWPIPTARPALGQGRVAAVPAKLWFEADRVLLLTYTCFASDLQERLA